MGPGRRLAVRINALWPDWSPVGCVQGQGRRDEPVWEAGRDVMGGVTEK